MTAFTKDCLDGKSLLITGGLGAIGQVVVTRLLDHSARVAVNDILPEEDARRIIQDAEWPGGRVLYVRADVTKPEGAQEVVAQTVKAFGGLDVALCNAGMAQSCAIIDYSEADWDEILDVNLKSAFLVAQASARSMIQRGVKGKIIFTSSWVQDVPWPGITPYNVTKSGMKMLMRGMARELAGYGIRVNSVAPGIVAAGLAMRQWDTEQDYRLRAQKAIPLGYMQPPESVADAFIFLCSDAADYITGLTLLADGGCSLYPMD
ncbi:MAG: SDR family oxidoreductase [Acidobacteriota bacterium]|nr:SDR family oxidoreductase [Acidobacteriota bacterium]